MVKEWWWQSGHINAMLTRSDSKGGKTKVKDENNIWKCMAKEQWWWSGHINGVLAGSNNKGSMGKVAVVELEERQVAWMAEGGGKGWAGGMKGWLQLARHL
jgi:hypothetical protein